MKAVLLTTCTSSGLPFSENTKNNGKCCGYFSGSGIIVRVDKS